MTQADDLVQLAIDVAREAGELARRRRGEGVEIAATKSAAADIVTAADREVEALIRRRLAQERAGDGFFGEESGAEAGTSGLTWVVDPIDGTVNYAYGIPEYAVSIAVVEGQPDPQHWHGLVGVVYAPAMQELFTATVGGGAWFAQTSVGGAPRRRLAVNEAPTDTGALVATGFGYDPATHVGDLARLGRVMPLARDIRRIGSASLDLAAVAAGRLDGYFERGLRPWDHAAGALLVEEAGGVVGGLPGQRPSTALTIAAGPVLFAQLEQAIDGR